MSVASQFRPDLDQADNRPPLFVTGSLPNGSPGNAYEGRLQILNQVGACTVEQIAGDTLPNGAWLYCDGDEVVVTWPAYSATPIELENPNFASGSIDGWTITKRGEISGFPAVGTADPARPYSGTYSAKWTGNEGLGHARGVEALWVNDTRATAYPGQRVNVSAMIALDDTDTSQNRGQVRPVFVDENGDWIGDPFDAKKYPWRGTLIRGNNEAYRLSEVGAIAPDGAVAVFAAVWTTANESPGSGVRFGAVQWDAPQVVGINVETTLCFTVTIRDSAGRTATWSGCVVIASASLRWYSAFGASPTASLRVTGADPMAAALATYVGMTNGLEYVDNNVLVARESSTFMFSYDGGKTFPYSGSAIYGSNPQGISANSDGSVVVWRGATAGADEYRWTPGGGIVSIMASSPANIVAVKYVGNRLWAVMGVENIFGVQALYYSDNDGSSWTYVRDVSPVSTYNATGTTILYESTTNVLAVVVRGNHDYAINYSTDGGSSWTVVNGSMAGSAFAGAWLGGGSWVLAFDSILVTTDTTPTGFITRTPPSIIGAGSGVIVYAHGQTIIQYEVGSNQWFASYNLGASFAALGVGSAVGRGEIILPAVTGYSYP